MTKETTKTINLIHLVSEGAVIVLYVLSIIPWLYYRLFWILIPLVVINLIFSTLKKDETQTYTAINVVMSFIAFTPIVGWLAIFVGIWMSMMSIQLLNEKTGFITTVEEEKKQDQDHDADVEVKTVKVTKITKKENTEE